MFRFQCFTDVMAFSVMFFIVFFAYAQIGYLMFGVHVSLICILNIWTPISCDIFSDPKL